MMNFLNRTNRFLARSIAVLNATLAILIVFFSAIGMAFVLSGVADGAGAKIALWFGGFILGTLLGSILALIFCGIIALLVDMRQLLNDIRDQTP